MNVNVSKEGKFEHRAKFSDGTSPRTATGRTPAEAIGKLVLELHDAGNTVSIIATGPDTAKHHIGATAPAKRSKKEAA